MNKINIILLILILIFLCIILKKKNKFNYIEKFQDIHDINDIPELEDGKCPNINYSGFKLFKFLDDYINKNIDLDSTDINQYLNIDKSMTNKLPFEPYLTLNKIKTSKNNDDYKIDMNRSVINPDEDILILEDDGNVDEDKLNMCGIYVPMSIKANDLDIDVVDEEEDDGEVTLDFYCKLDDYGKSMFPVFFNLFSEYKATVHFGYIEDTLSSSLKDKIKKVYLGAYISDFNINNNDNDENNTDRVLKHIFTDFKLWNDYDTYTSNFDHSDLNNSIFDLSTRNNISGFPKVYLTKPYKIVDYCKPKYSDDPNCLSFKPQGSSSGMCMNICKKRGCADTNFCNMKCSLIKEDQSKFSLYDNYSKIINSQDRTDSTSSRSSSSDVNIKYNNNPKFINYDIPNKVILSGYYNKDNNIKLEWSSAFNKLDPNNKYIINCSREGFFNTHVMYNKDDDIKGMNNKVIVFDDQGKNKELGINRNLTYTFYISASNKNTVGPSSNKIRLSSNIVNLDDNNNTSIVQSNNYNTRRDGTNNNTSRVAFNNDNTRRDGSNDNIDFELDDNEKNIIKLTKNNRCEELVQQDFNKYKLKPNIYSNLKGKNIDISL